MQIKKVDMASDRLSKTFGLLFFNSSLRTRLSSQKAAQLLGLESFVLDLANSWPLEFTDQVVMDQDKSEHIREAAPVISQYCDILGIRCFPGLKDRPSRNAPEILVLANSLQVISTRATIR